MTRYAVRITDAAARRIDEHAAFIAESTLDRAQALHWVRLVLAELATHERFPRRCPVAFESVFVGRELRQLRVAGHLLIFQVDDDAAVVDILWMRHTAQRPRPLPPLD